MTLFSVSLLLFLIMDPFGNINACNMLMNWVEPKKRSKVILREMFIALIAMLTICVIGDALFDILKVSEITVCFASGLIGFLFAINILFPSLRHPRNNLPKEEPFITPLAIPLIAGPFLLATIMLFAHSETIGFIKTVEAVLIAWVVATAIMLNSHRLQQLLGSNGLNACERLMGMILIMLAIQRFLEGTQLFIDKISRGA